MMLNGSSMKLTCDISVWLNSAQSKTIQKNIFSLTSAEEVWAGKTISSKEKECALNIKKSA